MSLPYFIIFFLLRIVVWFSPVEPRSCKVDYDGGSREGQSLIRKYEATK